MAAYLIVTARITQSNDPMREYMVRAQALALTYGAEYLTRGAPDLIYEGTTWTERGQQIVLIRFPTMTQLRAFFEGDAYRELVPLRAGTGDYDIVAFDGLHDMAADAAWQG